MDVRSSSAAGAGHSRRHGENMRAPSGGAQGGGIGEWAAQRRAVGGGGQWTRLCRLEGWEGTHSAGSRHLKRLALKPEAGVSFPEKASG